MRNAKPILLFAIWLAANAQTPAFEVVSIKPNLSDGGGSAMRLTAGRLTTENVSLKKLILAGYGIPDDRDYMVSGPDWMVTEHLDLAATFPAATPVPQVLLMMQAMLAERFHLALHRETRQLPKYSLVVAKNGLKIHAVEAGQPRTSGGPGHLNATKVTMQKLADLLAKQAGLPVTGA